MKLRSLLFGLLLCASAASAADVITRTDGTTINAKVEEITETTIRYRKATNTSGPIYSIPIASVVKIVYDNGDTDTFNAPAETNTQHATATQTTLTDEELMRYAETLAPITPASGAMSDAQLLKYGGYVDPADKIYAKAAQYRKIGWIGGGAIALVGIGVGSVLFAANDGGYWEGAMATITSVPVVGIVWCAAFNIRANQLKRKAQEMEFYSSSIIEDEILRFGDKSLTAGVSVMGNHMTHTQGYGLSLKLNF